MKEFFFLLFFGKSILLTPAPIVIDQSCVNLNPDKTLRVINGGALLEIQITAGSNGTPKVVNVVTARREINNLYPQGSITATLFRDDGTHVAAINTDAAIGKDFYQLNIRPLLLLNNAKPLFSSYREGDKFAKVSVCSKTQITNANVYWQTAME